MDADRRNDTGIFRYTDVEYTPEGHTDAYRWDDFLGIAGGHVYSAMDTIDMVSTGGQYEGDEPEHAYACEIVGCCGLSDGVALFRPVSHDGADLIQIAFLRNDVDDATGAYTERFEAGSFDLPAADLPRSEFGVDLLEYFSGRSFKYTPGVSRGLDPREAVDSIEDAIGCDLGLFDGFWLGVPGEADMRAGPYTKKSLLDFSYYAKELSCRYGFADSDILEIARHLPDECPDCLAAVKAYLDCEYVPGGDAPDEKTYRWGDFLEIAGGDARYAAMLVDRTAAGEPEAGLHPETLVDQDIRDGEAFMLAGRPIAPEDAYDLPGTVHGLYKELADNVDRLACSSATGAALPPAPMRTMCCARSTEETYQIIEGTPTLHDLDAENGFLWCPFGYSGRQNEPGILISRLDDGSYDVRLGTGLDSPERYAAGDPDWSWMDMAVDSTVDVTFPDDMALKDWIASETTATGAAWARCFNRYCGPDAETCSVKEITAALRRFESPSYLVRGPIEDIESLPVGYYWCPDAVDPDPSCNGYLLNVFAAFGGDGLPGKFFELFGGVTLNDVPSFGFDDGWDGSCLNRLDWFEDAVGMDPDGLSAGLVANDIESVKALVVNCPAWIECAPSYSEKAARGIDDVVQAVKAYRANAKRVDRKVIPGRIPERLFEGARAAAANTAGGADGGTGLHI